MSRNPSDFFVDWLVGQKVVKNVHGAAYPSLQIFLHNLSVFVAIKVHHPIEILDDFLIVRLFYFSVRTSLVKNVAQSSIQISTSFDCV
jgi:hypothetical protein